MSLYETRLQADLDTIRDRVQAVGKAIDDAVQRSVHALLEHDRALAYQIVIGDLPINRATREIDKLCHALVARHSPAAGHLRYVSSVLRLTIALERIGDYAVTIARQSVQLSRRPPAGFARDVELIASQARQMLTMALKAFNTKNAELARGTAAMAHQIDRTYDNVFNDLVAEHEGAPVKDLFALLGTFNQLERVSDQAKNICEETVFVVTGETKKPKAYNILFVDKTNSCHSILAEAIAKRAFANSGVYSSAGWAPREKIFPPLQTFADAKGIDLSSFAPSPLSRVHSDLADHHVIVCVRGDPMPHFESIPFHTALLEWNLADFSSDGSPEEIQSALEDLHQQLCVHVRLLMETMRGEGAD